MKPRETIVSKATDIICLSTPVTRKKTTTPAISRLPSSETEYIIRYPTSTLKFDVDKRFGISESSGTDGLDILCKADTSDTETDSKSDTVIIDSDRNLDHSTSSSESQQQIGTAEFNLQFKNLILQNDHVEEEKYNALLSDLFTKTKSNESTFKEMNSTAKQLLQIFSLRDSTSCEGYGSEYNSRKSHFSRALEKPDDDWINESEFYDIYSSHSVVDIDQNTPSAVNSLSTAKILFFSSGNSTYKTDKSPDYTTEHKNFELIDSTSESAMNNMCSSSNFVSMLCCCRGLKTKR